MDCLKLALGTLLFVSVQSMKLEVYIKPADEVAMPGTLRGLSPLGGSLPTSASKPNPTSRQSCPIEKDCKDNRIVGGCVVKPNSIPWQVGIVKTSDQTDVNCGGSIICPRFVLSAAHCIHKPTSPYSPILESDRRVAVGLHNRLKPDKVTFHEIKKFHRHPNYDPTKNDFIYDFSIMELKKPIDLSNKHAKAIYLPLAPDMPTPPVGTHFFVSGWGRLSITSSGCYPNMLNAVSLPSISLKKCQEAYHDDEWPVTQQMICTSYPGGGKDSCSGDSGGPLVWLDSESKKLIQIGIVSWGDYEGSAARCGKDGRPGVYSKVTEGLEWIKEIVGDCNKDTCDKGHCVTGETLNNDIQKHFFYAQSRRRFRRF